jgi:hypothetical protein
VFALGLVLGAANSVFADNGSSMRRGGRRQAPANHVSAFAALEPVGMVSGWGRIVLRDDNLPAGQERSVKAWVFGIEPHSSFAVEAEGVVVGVVTTDHRGDGFLELSSSSGKDVEVPSGLPPAGDVVTALVVDSSLAVVLEGTFSTVRQLEEDEISFENKVELVDVTGGSATGMACVRVMASGAQEFVSRASRLEPGVSHSVVVDGFPAGVVTADPEGQAALELAFPAEDNPLPDELMPVNQLEVVEWFRGETQLLVGSFEDEPECVRLEGTVVEVTDDGFVLETGDGPVKVVVTNTTHFKEFESLDQIDEGDRVVFEACYQADVLIAEWVWLVKDDDEPDCVEARGTVLRIGESEFVIESEGEELWIVVTDDTLFEGIEDLQQLGVEDVVVLEGCFDDEVIVAHWVKVTQDADEPECLEFHGSVAEVGVDEFVLVVGDDRLLVELTPYTLLKELESLEELGEGDAVAVEVCFEGEHAYALWVKLLEDADEPDCFEFRGTVGEVGIDEFVLVVGDDRLLIELTDETELKYFESLDQLGEGDVVRVEVCFEGEHAYALWVKLMEIAGDPECDEIQGTVAEVGIDEFVLVVGDDRLLIELTDETELKYFESLDQLGEGDVVRVEVCFEGEHAYALWVKLLEDADEPDCDDLQGTVAEVGIGEFVLVVGDDRLLVEVTHETLFKEFESLDQLGEGDLVLTEGCFEDGRFIAFWVKLLVDADAPTWWEVHGSVVEFFGGGFAIDTSEEILRVLVNGETDYLEVAGLDGLGVGDFVFAEGPCDGETMEAALVKLIEDADAPAWWEVDGSVVEFFEGGFAVDTGEEVLRVLVNGETDYLGVDGLEGLGAGDFVFVEGPCDGETMEAALVKLIEAAA